MKLKNIIPRASDLALNLLENILCLNPMKRLTASQCLQHPFFQCYDILSIYGLKLNSGISSSVISSNFSQSLNENTNINLNLQKKNSNPNTNILFSNTMEKKKKSNMNNINK